MKNYIKPEVNELILEKTIMADDFIHQSMGDQHQLSKEIGFDDDDAEEEFGKTQMSLWD
ncbi:MAG: hypothetical protein J6T52_00890 [Bacteroidaceae bacterium]|nr:hypothetical protein [Bacteroidaceae bacterium]